MNGIRESIEKALKDGKAFAVGYGWGSAEFSAPLDASGKRLIYADTEWGITITLCMTAEIQAVEGKECLACTHDGVCKLGLKIEDIEEFEEIEEECE